MYENIRELIEQKLPDNLNEEISARRLRDTLNAMIDSLGFGGSLYGGIITPNTVINTPQKPTAYVTEAPGQYTMSGVVYNTNNIGIFNYNNGWTFQEIPIYEVLTEAEYNAIADKEDKLYMIYEDE